MPDAAGQLRHLTDTGHRVFVLGEPPAAARRLPSIVRRRILPDSRRNQGPGWSPTDPELCIERRPPMTTMLVGSGRRRPRALHRAATRKRETCPAVLEILGHEAMG